jgi:GNAT superfamily N-acetyltransferase
MRATESGEIEAFRSMFAAAPTDLKERHGIAATPIGDGLAFRVESLAGVAELNHALGVGTEDGLDELVDFYGETAHVVSALPGIDLDSALAARGYTPGHGWMKFSRSAEEAPPAVATDLRVGEVGEERAGDFARALCGGYGLPEFLVPWLELLPGRAGWHCFVAYEGADPVGAGAFHVHEGVCWIGMGATVPAHRGRGAQNAILAARIRRAGELGCETVVTETGEFVDGRPSGSYRNILRAGFEEEYLRPNHLSRR